MQTYLTKGTCSRQILFDVTPDNKVEQAAGRVIRTSEDVGVIALLDDRFLQNSYRRLFPREWSHFKPSTTESISGQVSRFWDAWL